MGISEDGRYLAGGAGAIQARGEAGEGNTEVHAVTLLEARALGFDGLAKGRLVHKPGGECGAFWKPVNVYEGEGWDFGCSCG